MRKFKHPVDLKAAADAASLPVPVDLTLAELVQAHSLAKPRLELELRLRKWCDPINGFGHESAWSISSERLQKAADALVEAGYATSTVNRDVGALGQVFRWAIVNRRMAPRGFTSPTLAVKRFEEKIRYVASSEQDILSLRLAAKMGRDRLFTLFVWMLVDSGARKSELLQRSWQELDIVGGKLIVPRTKNGDSRTLFFTPETMALAKRLKPALTAGYADRLIFAGRNGISPICYRKKWSSMTGMLRRPDLRVHDIRHWVAASLLRNGVGVGVASQILGHRDQTMLLRRYGHLDHMSLLSAQQMRWQSVSASTAQLNPKWSLSDSCAASVKKD
jgi:integrase